MESDLSPVIVTQWTVELLEIEDDDGAGNDNGLAHLDAIDAGQDVDGVGTKDGQHAHVDIVEETQVNVGAKQRSQDHRHHSATNPG